MGRNKGAHEQKRRGDYDMRPKNWLEKKPLAFLSKGESRHSVENLKRMDDYLRLNKVQPEWYDGNCNGEMALLASINSQPKYFKMIQHEAYARRCNVRYCEWAPVKGGESLKQNIPLRTFQDLIRNENPSELYRIYIVSEDDTIFYVGQANNPISRLCKRLNPYDGEKKESFANFLRTYIDDAFSTWRVQLLTLQDCESLVIESFLMPECEAEVIKSAVIEKYTTNIKWASDQAERFLIWLYQPCINNKHTPFPTQLPAKYSNFSIPYSHVLLSSQR